MEYRKYYRNQVFTKNIGKNSFQNQGKPVPPMEKPFDNYELIPLPIVEPAKYSRKLVEAIIDRKSYRKYKDEEMSIEELSLLLYSTQGVKQIVRNGLVTFRTVPSGGAMHPFETYLLIINVKDLKQGLYRYIATKHSLVFEKSLEKDDLKTFSDACYGQSFVVKGNVVFIWTVRPERSEWRYGEDSLKDVLLSCGHICQNLYLACGGISSGTCAIVAYSQVELDKFIGVDGINEIVLYLSPVGKI